MGTHSAVTKLHVYAERRRGITVLKVPPRLFFFLRLQKRGPEVFLRDKELRYLRLAGLRERERENSGLG